MTLDPTVFEPWLQRWALTPDGAPIAGTWASLLPVRRGVEPAMLKAAMTREEQHGLDLLAWYDGDGAVRILERADKAILMERAMGTRSLKAMARAGEDEAALAVLCAAADRLHAPRGAAEPKSLQPLSVRFRPLEAAAIKYGGVLVRCWDAARTLLATSRDERPLHGDLWHDNVREDDSRGWLVIDPMGFHGERTYDYAVMLTNPDFPEVAADPGRIRRRAAFVAELAGLELDRLIRCMLVDAGLYAVWSMSGGHEPRALAVAEVAATMVAGAGG
jgi:streptomycin 6-kinase